MFYQYQLTFTNNMFNELSHCKFETITNGRIGANLVKLNDTKIPIVRTTTKYYQPAQKFSQVHLEIIEKIKETTPIKDLDFNNALIEVYDSKYTKMGFHSDQMLDLQDNSYIAIFSCYENDTSNETRTLIIKNKETNQENKIILKHNSVVLFSLTTNSTHLHKIILEKPSTNKWLGITFRLSKTFINFIDNVPYLPNGNELKLNDDIDFYKYRNLENKLSNYSYPEINYTISPSDLLYLNDQ